MAVRHAAREDLERIEALLVRIRRLDGVRERRPGVFYAGARALVHFHEDAGSILADVRFDHGWERMRVDTAPERAELLRQLERARSARPT